MQLNRWSGGLTLLSLALFASLLLMTGVQAQPAPVVIGTFVNRVQDVDFRDNRYTIDFYLWFRWKAEGPLKDYKPLNSFEIINGTVQGATSVVEKAVGDENYAIVRVNAIIAEHWNLANYPFDGQSLHVNIENSDLTAEDAVFVVDKANSALGDELGLTGWRAKNFRTFVDSKVYRSNYGDVSLPTDAKSVYSRFVFGMDIERTGYGSAIKLLSTVLLSTAVAFLAFAVKPSDLDARFGMGVGALFAAAASAIIAASEVPRFGGNTMADVTHMVAILVIFGTLLISTVCLRLEVSGREQRAIRIDRVCIVALPTLFYGWVAWSVWRATH